VGWAWPVLVRPPLVLGQDAITDAATASAAVTLEEAGGRTIVARPPAGVVESDLLVVLYPGGLVRPQAYEWLARALAAQGHVTVIPEFSFDLAVTGIARADELVARYGTGKRVVLAGHSLGGAMAAQYAADRVRAGSGVPAGLVLLAAYPASGADLAESGVHVLSVTAEHDGLVNAAALAEAWARLPSDTERVTIAGSVHAFFGRYGPQSGDGTPTVDRATAEAELVTVLAGFLARLA
jgi:dienelactone hydrolase